jgi:hypothetical protein
MKDASAAAVLDVLDQPQDLHFGRDIPRRAHRR